MAFKRSGVQFSSAPPKRKSGFAETQALFSFLPQEVRQRKAGAHQSPGFFVSGWKEGLLRTHPGRSVCRDRGLTALADTTGQPG